MAIKNQKARRRVARSNRSQISASKAVSRMRSGIVPVLEDLRKVAVAGKDRAELEFKVLSAVRRIKLNLDAQSNKSQLRHPHG
jgi:hypothetical protein